MDKYRIERLQNNGYNPIHLFGRWYLNRHWSKCRKDWRGKIPLYTLFYLKPDEPLAIDTNK